MRSSSIQKVAVGLAASLVGLGAQFLHAAGPSALATAHSEAAPETPSAGCTGRPIGWPCDDANPCTGDDSCGVAGICAGTATSPTPAEIGDLRIGRSGTDAVLRYTVPEDAIGVNVVRGKLAQGRVSPLGVGQTCLGRGLDPFTTEVTDYGNPPAGTGYWYLVRATNACGLGAWGSERAAEELSARLTECGCTPDPGTTQANRYVDHVYTVTDRVTCLEWEKKVGGGLHDLYLTLNWYDSMGFTVTPPNWVGAVNDERFAGHGDWRLPTSWGPPDIRTETSPELESLLLVPCPGYPAPCVDPALGPIPTGPSIKYWSASTIGAPYGPTYAWNVDMITGSWEGAGKRFYFDHVRAVRGGF